MASFYIASVEEFLVQSEGEVLSRLATGYANRGYTQQYSDQTLTWERDLRSLRHTLQQCVQVKAAAGAWGLLLEFSIPRKESRIDAVLLIGESIAIIEAKTGPAASQARRQVEEYALLLHYFHKASDRHRIIPILVSPEPSTVSFDPLNQQELFEQLSAYWIKPVLSCSWTELASLLLEVGRIAGPQMLAKEWDQSPYHPVPSIIEAALALRTGLSIQEVAHSEASEHEIGAVCATLQNYVDRARSEHQHAICFITGVPGSGKTLVGLSLTHADMNKADPIHFMSGNGPLVTVLQHLFTKEGQRKGLRAAKAKRDAATLIENVHIFAKYHTGDNLGAPFNHAIIFDEAQRAWNKAQNLKKFKRDYSEPEMLLSIMERHEDWAMVIALVGGGQEINDGEAGLEEWGRALAGSNKNWAVYASPEVIDGGESTAGHRLFQDSLKEGQITTNPALHLRTSNRSLRAERLATWVNLVLDGKADQAADLKIAERFPIFLSRDLTETRRELHKQKIGSNRYGLAGSSAAARLRAEGLEPNSSFHAGYPWEHWYLADESDIRSCYRCEVFATEFEIQGLELDWIGLCWGGDFIWDNNKGYWRMRRLQLGSPTKWNEIKNSDRRIYRQNAYRVLLTRARQGMVIFVPKGNIDDPSNSPSEFEETARYLVSCGVIPLQR